MENPNTPTPSGTPPEAARYGLAEALKDIEAARTRLYDFADGWLGDEAAEEVESICRQLSYAQEAIEKAAAKVKNTPPEAADAGRSVEKSALIAEALEITRRLWEIKNQLAPEDFTLDQTDTLACRLWLFQTDALGCWADYRTPNDIVERYDGKITRDQAFRALADCHSSEYLSEDIYRTVGDYVNDVINADKEGSSK